MNKLTDWLRKWFPTETEDDRRNFGWRLTEHLAVKVDWATTLLDLRIYFTRKDGQRVFFYLAGLYPTRQNFWNGFITIQIYLVKWTAFKFLPFAWPKLLIVVRPCKSRVLEISTPGLLFDRGEFHAKFAFMRLEASDATNWNEGSV